MIRTAQSAIALVIWGIPSAPSRGHEKFWTIAPVSRYNLFLAGTKTAPLGPPQPDYINACAILEVQLEAHTIWENRSAIAQHKQKY